MTHRRSVRATYACRAPSTRIRSPSRRDAASTRIALEIAQLRLAPDAALGMSIGERYDRAVSELASVTRTALDASQAQHALAQHSAGLRDSVMGVSTDEEMVELIRLQNAFAAAARVITVADEMMRTVIEMKR
jgi:flagellar hook-associated protein 1 FlgK